MYPNPATALPLPPRPSLDQYKKLAKDLVKACKSDDPEALRTWASEWLQRLASLQGAELRASIESQIDPLADFARSKPVNALADAQFVIARAHGFKSWPRFAQHLEALKGAGSPVSRFESAADAIVTGDAATLRRLLREDPELVRACSTREHRATLLHYIGANGFEDFRQKSPKNAVEIAKILLDAGAAVDGLTEGAMGIGTPLGLIATSIHPVQAGVQIELLGTLLDYGASVDGAPGGWNPLLAALHNGRPRAAEFLAQRGARLDLEGAAGIGWLDRVQSFFTEDGGLKANATRAQMENGFLWACEYGRNSVVEFLLEKGMDLRARGNTGLTGLHWAIVGGQLDTIRLLLERGAPLEERNVYGGTALGQALWSVLNSDPGVDYVPIIETLIHAGAEIEPGSLAWLARQDGRSTVTKARVEELLRRHEVES
ncbi:MAG TPA: ankyrin repeat domain-containing protein [Thermoanaerobaculia bacterium]|nr:ankyrin repeat domain-containing protein [Thermoanaerobaculia bacterium]